MHRIFKAAAVTAMLAGAAAGAACGGDGGHHHGQQSQPKVHITCWYQTNNKPAYGPQGEPNGTQQVVKKCAPVSG